MTTTTKKPSQSATLLLAASALLLTGCGDEPARLLNLQLLCTLDGKAYTVAHRLLAVAALHRNTWADVLCKEIPRKEGQ